ncbi:MAG TPA: hypothetical protein VK783_16835 [Bacteroidia bacterium]|jgi:hypothetical protein|nr:hypothetical protein [Bacteroidia bacterium]
MKKSIVVLSALVLFAGVSFGQDASKAAPAKQDAKTAKAGDAKDSKKDGKATKPAAKPAAKDDKKAADKK